MKFLISFITLGHFLLLSSSPAAEVSGSCEYHLTSPVLPGSGRNCVLQVALYETVPASGNLTLLIKPVLSGSAVRSVVFNRRRRDGRRSANTLSGQTLRASAMLFVHTSYLCAGVHIMYAAHIHLISVKKKTLHLY